LNPAGLQASTREQGERKKVIHANRKFLDGTWFASSEGDGKWKPGKLE